MHSLIPQQLNNRLDQILTKCFEGNRIADRGMSVLGVKFAMNKTENVLHAKLAHLYPSLADKISSYQGFRNNLTFYGVTPADNSDYTSPLDFFDIMFQYMIDLENLVAETAVLAQDEDDFTTYSFLQEFSRNLIPVTAQCLLLLDKAENYKDWMQFDRDVENFIIL